MRKPRIRTATRRWPQAAELALVALAYWGAVRLGLLFVAHPGGIASIWPASGLALAVLLLSPQRLWARLLAVILVINAAGNWSGGNSLLVSLGFALANSLEAFLAAWALIYFCTSKITFGRTAEILALFGVAILGNGITAVLGAAVPALAFGAPFLSTWWIWWAADGLGMILVTTVIVTWVTNHNVLKSVSPRRLVEKTLLVVALAVFAWLLYGPFTVAEGPLLRNYMVFPLLILLSFAFSPRGMAGALLLFATIAIWNTLQGHGVFGFADQAVSERLVSVQVFLMVTSFSGLLLSAIVAERKKAADALRESEEKYRTVADFTYDWEAWGGPEGRYRYVSPSCERITGHTAAEFLADQNLIVHITHPDDQAKVIEHYRAATHEAQEHDLELDFRIHTPGGEIRWMNHRCTAVYGQGGQWLGRRESNRDITERSRAEGEVRRQNQELAHLNTELVRETAALAEANATITRIAATDDLTNLANRRHFYEALDKAVSLARRHGSPLALVSFDLDGMKRVNDSAGHEAGDEVLTTFAALLGSLCRVEDLPARLGGDEFSLLMPGIDLSGARGLAERVLAAARSCKALEQRGVTASGGAAAWWPDELPDDLLRRADEALYAAKRSGGDSVTGGE